MPLSPRTINNGRDFNYSFTRCRPCCRLEPAKAIGQGRVDASQYIYIEVVVAVAVMTKDTEGLEGTRVEMGSLRMTY